MQRKCQVMFHSHLQDLNPILAGSAEASAENFKTFTTCDYTLLHYVMEGQGTFFLGDRAYPVHTGQAFLILPGATVRFEADRDDPWALRWVGFGGNLSHSFSQLPPVFDVPEQVWNDLCDLSDPLFPSDILSYLLSSELFLLYAKMLNPINKNRNYVEQVIDYVQQHYTEKLTVGQIAAKLGLTRSYLTDLFHRKMGKSIQEYIIGFRILTAKQLMTEGCSVRQAAAQCGFNDYSYFTRRFTKETGVTPSQWLKRYKERTKKYLETSRK